MSLGSDKPRAVLPMGHIDAIENKHIREEEPARWARIRLQDEDGAEGTFLFTFEDIKNAMVRTYAQREDLPDDGRLRTGHIGTIENLDRKDGEPATWARIRLKDEDGADNTFLFSFEEIKNAMNRASTQSEDLPPEGWLQKLQDLLD